MSMISTIASAVTPAAAFPFSSASAPSASPTVPSFGATLQGALSDVNSLQNRAGTLAQDFAVGKTSDVHTVMIAAEQATLAIQLTTQVRNKVVEAYQQIMQISM